MQRVTFTTRGRILAKVQAAYRRNRRRIQTLLPAAGVEHIGSTAIPGAVTKGDLDILVRVTRRDFARADRVLAAHYPRNLASLRDGSFSSFKEDTADPPLGIQLTVRGGAQDRFLEFRDALRASPQLLARYNRLKRASSGLIMSAYRRRKSAFIEEVLAGMAP